MLCAGCQGLTKIVSSIGNGRTFSAPLGSRNFGADPERLIDVSDSACILRRAGRQALLGEEL